MAEMLIGGEWRAGRARARRSRSSTRRPRRSSASVPERHGRRRRARRRHRQAAFPEWARTDVEQRAHVLAKAAALIEEHAKSTRAAADLRAGQAGRRGARRGHPPRPRRALLRRGGHQGPRRLPGAARPRSGPPTGMVIRRPMGVCAAITPYNFPLTLLGTKVAPGAGERQHGRRQAGRDDAAGDARGRAPLRRGRRARRRAQRRHRPRLGDRRRARRPSRRPPRRVHRLDRGRPPHRWRSPRPQLKRVTLELGGSDPVIVCADADVETAVKAVIIGRYWNAGQACLGCKRVFVARLGLRRASSSQLVERVGRYEPGDGTVKAEKPKLRMGPIHTRCRPRRAARADRGRRRQGRRGAHRRRHRRPRQGLLPRAGGRRRAGGGLAARARGGLRPGAAGVPLHATSTTRSGAPTTRRTASARRSGRTTCARSTAPRRRSTPA